MPITEDTPQSPINPYGWSKLMTERALMDYGHMNKEFGFAALRYFNTNNYSYGDAQHANGQRQCGHELSHRPRYRL